MKTFLKTFLVDESGASAAEYALILSIVGVALGAAALGLSVQISQSINNAADTIEKCNTGDPSCAAPTAAAT
jgi:pilus assembly protein Flp/PilA